MASFTVFKGSKEGKIVQSTTTREIKADEVLIRVTHSGVCGTDEHYRHADIVLGHEGAGVVEVHPLLLVPSPNPLTKSIGTRICRQFPC